MSEVETCKSKLEFAWRTTRWCHQRVDMTGAPICKVTTCSEGAAWRKKSRAAARVSGASASQESKRALNDVQLPAWYPGRTCTQQRIAVYSAGTRRLSWMRIAVSGRMGRLMGREKARPGRCEQRGIQTKMSSQKWQEFERGPSKAR